MDYSANAELAQMILKDGLHLPPTVLSVTNKPFRFSIKIHIDQYIVVTLARMQRLDEKH